MSEPAEDLNTTPLGDLKLSSSIVKTLTDAGIHSVAEILGSPDEDLLRIKGMGKAKLAAVQKAIEDYDEEAQEETAEPAPAFEKAKKSQGRPNTQREANLMDAAERANNAALVAQQNLRAREAQFRKLCDDLLGAGNSADQIRAYWPEYESPEEREG